MKKNVESKANFRSFASNASESRRICPLLYAAAFACFVFFFAACAPSAFAAFATPRPSPLATAQVNRLTMESQAFGSTVPFMVYLPAGYESGEQYPVWYAMHGYSSTEKMWLNEAGIGDVADSLIARGALTPMIMVFPLSRYDSAQVIQQDMADGKRDASGMEQFLCDELIPYIDSHYATVVAPEGRYIGGFSMGGLFALQIGLHRPDLFGKIGAYSPALATADFSGERFERWLSTDPAAAASLDDYATTHNLDSISIYLDCGDARDPFSAGASSLYEALTARGIQVAFHPHDGGHSLRLDLLENYLLFYAGA